MDEERFSQRKRPLMYGWKFRLKVRRWPHMGVVICPHCQRGMLVESDPGWGLVTVRCGSCKQQFTYAPSDVEGAEFETDGGDE